MMKIKSLLLLLCLVSGSLFAQFRAKTSTDVDITVNDLGATEKKIEAFLAANALKPVKYNRTKYHIEIELYAPQTVFDKLVGEYRSWGYISSEKTGMVSYEPEMAKLRDDILHLQQQLETYRTLAAYADSNVRSSYLGYREKMLETEKLIYQSQAKLAEYTNGSLYNFVQLDLREEANSTMDYSSSWVNMPGVEYSHLWVEQPRAGITPSVMHGVSLKYMFNTGKSYGILGLYKNYDTKTLVNEAYLFAFGQDFYSRRMGRGQRKFLNLYTSFNAGVYILTGEEQKSASWFINPFLGLELFKNKYFLIDNKVGYFLPYKDNRDLRGLLYNVSFNFVF